MARLTKSPARDQVENAGMPPLEKIDWLTVEVRGPKWFDVKNGTERASTCEWDGRETAREGASETKMKDARGEAGASDCRSERDDGSAATESGGRDAARR